MDRFRLMPNYRYYNTEGASPLTLEKSVGKSLRDYKIYGDSVQDGMPTPDAPVEIQSVGDKSKNLFDIDTFLSLNGNSAYYSKNEKGELVQLKPDYRSISTIPIFITLPAGTYRFSMSNVDVKSFYLTVNGASIGNNAKTLTLTDVSTVGFKSWESAETVLGYIQLEEGETATEYEPYYDGYRIPITVNEDTYNIYLDEPLSDGEYLDFINQRIVRAETKTNISLPTIKTHKGTNIITVGTTVPASNIAVQYYK